MVVEWSAMFHILKQFIFTCFVHFRAVCITETANELAVPLRNIELVYRCVLRCFNVNTVYKGIAGCAKWGKDYEWPVSHQLVLALTVHVCVCVCVCVCV